MIPGKKTPVHKNGILTQMQTNKSHTPKNITKILIRIIAAYTPYFVLVLNEFVIGSTNSQKLKSLVK